MSCDLPVIVLTAGQVSALPLVFRDAQKVPINLTGAVVHLAIKVSFSDPDILLKIEQDTHSNATAGETSLPIDLSSGEEKWFSTGARYAASLWIVDAASQVIPWGNCTVQIDPSAIPRITP
jgi:hypothetical protein